jgi:Ser/Thr protein kinase RdoA (MazF antagonist)
MSIPPLQIPAGLAAAYGVNQGDFRFITQVQNYIFAHERNGEEFILRLTPQTHQSPEQVRAEVDWVNDLAGRGVPVAGVVPARDGSLYQAVELVGRNLAIPTGLFMPISIFGTSALLPPD